MPKAILKPGRVVIMLNGRFAGHKGVILKAFEKSRARPYGHALIAGIEKYPRKVVRSMTKYTIMKRSTVKPFIKMVNFNHFMPTRYSFETEGMTQLVTPEKTDVGKRIGGQVKRKLKNLFQQRYRSGKNRWFFTKLRF